MRPCAALVETRLLLCDLCVVAVLRRIDGCNFSFILSKLMLLLQLRCQSFNAIQYIPTYQQTGLILTELLTAYVTLQSLLLSFFRPFYLVEYVY